MIRQIISEIEARVQSSNSVEDRDRTELLKLIGALKSEITDLSKSHGEEAEQIAGAALASTKAATRTQKDPQLLKSAIEELSASATEFEASHPKLVELVNRICLTLANLGI